MKSALALVITSKHEGFPTILLEAWASKLPVIARDILPLKVLAKLYPGSIALFKNVKEAVKLLEVLDREKLSNTGEKAVKDFDAKVITKKYYELYKKLTK